MFIILYPFCYHNKVKLNMYKFKEDEMKVPYVVEKGSIEQGAMEQIKNVSSHCPFAFPHSFIMPDSPSR